MKPISASSNTTPLLPALALIAVTISFAVHSETSLSTTVIADHSQFSSKNKSQDYATRALADLALEHEFNQNFSFFTNVQVKRGSNGNEYIGDAQAFSNIDESNFQRIYELWGNYQLDSGQTNIKAGLIDLNTEFAFADNAGEFINSSMGFSPTIIGLPTYPEPTLGVVLTQSISHANKVLFAINAAADRTDFDDKFYMGEWQHQNELFTAKFGYWHHDGAFENLRTGQMNNGTSGTYFIAQGQIDDKYLGYYIQLGQADKNISEITHHYGIGLFGQFKQHQDLFWGIGITKVDFSEHLDSSIQEDSEIAYEVFIKYQLSETIAIKPDIQYIANPSGNDNNTLILTLRVELSL